MVNWKLTNICEHNWYVLVFRHAIKSSAHVELQINNNNSNNKNKNVATKKEIYFINGYNPSFMCEVSYIYG